MTGPGIRRSSRKSLLVLALVVCLVPATLTALPAGAQAPAGNGQGKAVVPKRFNGRVADLPPAAPGRGDVPIGADTVPQGQADPAAGGSATPGGDGAGPGPGVSPPEFTNAVPNFDGINVNQAGFNPPDTHGDVGPNHYVQIVNASFRIWDKQGLNPVPAAGVRNINQLWVNAGDTGQCATENRGDPIVLYDHLADRWLISQFAFGADGGFGGTDNAECIAISQTPDPGGAYFVYTFPIANGHDYPKLGVWPDAYLMSGQRGFSGGNLDVYALDRANMLNGNPATVQARTIAGPALTVLPADLDGNPPAPGTPAPFARHVDRDLWGGPADRVEVFELDIDWINPAATTLAMTASLPVLPFSSDICAGTNLFNNCIAQPGGGTLLEVLPHWAMGPLQYRDFGSHTSMTFNHSVDVDGAGNVGVRWYELRNSGGVWGVHQQGTHAPDDNNPGLADDVDRWMGSIAMDMGGNMALGYSAASTTEFPDVRYTGRLATDPLGLMTQGTPGGSGEVLLVDGTTASGGTRWGDYSAMRVDPTDGCTFWYTQEYGGANNWDSRIGAFRFPTCNPADLRISKLDSPDPVNAGEQLTYTITVANNGPNTAFGVTVTDVLPAGVDFLNSAPTCTNAAGTLTCPMGDILAGQTVTLVIQVGIPSGFLGSASTATITNTATVAADAQDDPNLVNNTATATTTVKALADIAVTKVCKPDDPAPAGGTGFCDVHVDNLGPSDAVNVSLTDVLTSATPFTVTGVTVSPSGTCNPTASGPTTSFSTVCDLGTEPAGGRSTIHVEVTADDVAQINDVATVSSDTPDPNPANNQAVGKVQFTGSADLSLDKTGPNSVVAGTQLTYVITVTNNGPSTAQGVVVTDRLPEGVSFVSVTPSQGTCTNGQPTARDLRCGVGNLAPNAQVTITTVGFVSPGVAPGTILFNEAEVSSATADPDTSNNRDSVPTVVSASAGLSITKADSPDPVVAGNLLTYTITVANAGPSTAENAVVTDTLPQGTTFVSGQDGNGATVCTLVQAGTVTCDLGSMAPGTSKQVFLTVKVAPSVPHGSVLTNTASVSSSTPDPDPSNNTITTTTTVNASAELWLDKTGVRRSGNPAPVLVYTLTVHNDAGCESDAQSSPTPTCGLGGPSDAQNITVTDVLPLDPKKVVVQFISPQCTYTKATHTVVCSATTVPAGASVQFVIEAQVAGSVRTITNTATLASTTADPVATNNTNAATVVVKGGTGKN